MKQTSKHRILILGASGFIGRTIFRELDSYFEVYGTYCTNAVEYGDNQVYHKFCLGHLDLNDLLRTIQPTIVISSLRGDFKKQFEAHRTLCEYALANHNFKLIYLSSASVFDGKFDLPSYEYDRPIAESNYGKFKMSVEKMLLEQIPAQTTILRLPMVLGINSPRIVQLRNSIKINAEFDVFPNLIISITTASKIAQQIHYIINRQLDGIYHLASNDMVHHEDLFREITSKLGDNSPIFKSVYRRNDDSYLAILPKKNKLPAVYKISVSEVIDESTLKDEIITLKNN